MSSTSGWSSTISTFSAMSMSAAMSASAATAAGKRSVMQVPAPTVDFITPQGRLRAVLRSARGKAGTLAAGWV